MSLTWHHSPPEPGEYLALRDAAGLGRRSHEGAVAGLPRTLFALTVREREELIAMGRVVGDGGCFVQLVDIAVRPDHQRQGLGKEVTSRLLAWCEGTLPPTCHISLVASEAAVSLYERFGFEPSRGMDRYADPTLRLTK